MTLAGRRRRRTPLIALAVSSAANLLLLTLLAFPGGYLIPAAADTGPRPVAVSVARLVLARRLSAPSSAPPSAAARRSPGPPVATLPAPPAIAPPPTAPPAPVAQPPGVGGADVAAALRRGPVGCAHQGAAWMSAADRDACRERLAAGAASVPHLQGMAPQKLAYYAAVAQAEEDWRTGRNTGHLPYIGCTPGRAPPPHALKIGPCFIDPPVGSLDPAADIPPP